MLADSRNPDSLLDAWRSWHTIGVPMRDRYARFVALSNAGARAMGFADAGAMWRAGYDMPPDSFVVVVDKLWQEVRPLYVQLHAYVRRRLVARYGAKLVPPGGMLPVQLLGNMWGQDWSNIADVVVPPLTGGSGIDLTAIPYKGGAPAISDLLGGQIMMSFNNAPESIGQLQAGTLRALAVTTAARAPFLPDVPSMSEGVPGYDTEVWWGLLGPANMPADLLAKLASDFIAALNTDAVKERLKKLGALPIGGSPRQFREKIQADYDKWGPIIKAAGMKAE